MNGSPVIRCNARNERWEPRPPICVAGNRYNSPTCYALDAPINGRKLGICSEGAVAGSVCSFDCRVGYVLSGQTSLVCQVDGRWDSEPPQCHALSDRNSDGTCSRLPVPFRGNMTGDCNPGIQGRRCSFYCYPGYVLVGYKTLYCTVDGWSSNVPTCRGEIKQC
ncbi:P-selectin-like protein [Leptotrombidium deliense]|uniref:P-selectin-like protein n=1 Tax=Leptotrombidium deliense TaxID=299467 RepID=A0A443S168_9ACAR|nr:P-selectin-like protein [Leptotrombidium deliense]